MEERESSGIKQQNRQTEIKLLINFKLVLTDAGESDFKIVCAIFFVTFRCTKGSFRGVLTYGALFKTPHLIPASPHL